MVLDIPVKISSKGKAHKVRAASALTEHFPHMLEISAFPKLNFLYLSTEYILIFICHQKAIIIIVFLTSFIGYLL